jgi:hypothetical protein
MSLLETIKKSLDNSVASITPQQKNFINHILETSPDIFSSIENDLKDIMEDNKITLSEIPKMINIISKIYYNHAIQNELEKTNNVIFLAEFTINIIIDNTLYVLPEIEKDLIKKAVDNSIELLAFFGNTTNNNNEEKCWLFKFCS